MKTILMVDDNEADHFLTREMIKLEYPDVEILTAYDGEQALEMLRGQDIKPDLILLDINMPRMNGHEFLAEYSDNNTRELPIVIMLTSSSQERDRNMAMQYHCVKGYLTKPVMSDNIPEIEEMIKNS